MENFDLKLNLQEKVSSIFHFNAYCSGKWHENQLKKLLWFQTMISMQKFHCMERAVCSNIQLAIINFEVDWKDSEANGRAIEISAVIKTTVGKENFNKAKLHQ